jgi:hypothetical protein
VDAPPGIEIGVDDPVGVGEGTGVGAGVGDEYPLPQAAASSVTANTNTKRDDNIEPRKSCESIHLRRTGDGEIFRSAVLGGATSS